MWIALIILAGLVTLILCWPVRVEAQFDFALPRGGEGRIVLRFLSGLVRLPFRLELNLRESERFLLFAYKDRDWRVLYAPGGERKPPKWKLPLKKVWETIRVKKFCLKGELGIEEDAFLTAMLAGALGVLLQCAALILTVDKNQSGVYASVKPAFDQNCLRMNFEGIFGSLPVQIISIVIFFSVKHRKGREAAWHILSKTS